LVMITSLPITNFKNPNKSVFFFFFFREKDVYEDFCSVNGDAFQDIFN